MPDPGVATFWRRCARGCHLGSLSAHLPPRSVAEARGWGGPLGCLPEVGELSGPVKAGNFRGGILGLSEATRAFFLESLSLGREPTEPRLRHLAAPAVPDIVLRLYLGRRLRPISTNCLPSRSPRGLVTRVRVLLILQSLLMESTEYIVLLL